MWKIEKSGQIKIKRGGEWKMENERGE